MQRYFNFLEGRLAASISDSDTEIEVICDVIPSIDNGDYFYIVLDYRKKDGSPEIVKVTAISGTTFTVERGSLDTTARSHTINTLFGHGVLAEDLAVLDNTLEIIDPELRQQQLYDTLIGLGATEENATTYSEAYTFYINTIAGTDQPENVVAALEIVGKLFKFALSGMISLQGQLTDSLAITDDTLEVLDPDTRNVAVYNILRDFGMSEEMAQAGADQLETYINHIVGSDQPTDVKSSVIIISKLLSLVAGISFAQGYQIGEIGNIIGQLGTAANHAAEDFATAAQGELADTAIQPGDKQGLNWRGEAAGTWNVAVDDDVIYSSAGDPVTWTLPAWSEVPQGARYIFIGKQNHYIVAPGPSGNGIDDFTVTPYSPHYEVDVPVAIDGVIEVVFDAARWHIVNRTSEYVRTSEVGSAAYADTGDFATATQGSTADSAVQPGDLPDFGDIVTHDTSEFAAAGHTHTSQVEDSITDGVTDKAPSENAVFDALAGKASTGHNHDGTYSPVGHDHNGVYDPAGTAASKIEDSITNGVTDKAPSQNAVFDALALKGTASTKTDVGLGNVDNTSDVNKPVSTAQQSALDAKRHLQRVTFSNADYIVAVTKDALVAQTGTLSAARTVTLPAANALPAGAEIIVIDQSGSVTTTNTIIIQRAGSDTINGATSETITGAYGWRRLVSDGTSSWSFDGGITRSTNIQTLTNKRITKRVATVISSATPMSALSTDNYDAVTITALATAITSMTPATSSPSNFDSLLFRIKDDGTARAITWGSSYASRGATLPTTTTAGKVTTVGFFYNSVTLTWDCTACVTEL